MADDALARVLAGVPRASWEALARTRVWFGHQSVGGNIMQGVADLASSGAAPIAPPVETRRPGPGVSHALNGQNMRPDLKIQAFAEFVNDEIRGEVDLAFFKFCYVDISLETDVAALFASYQTTMSALASRHPSVRFVHVTCPVTTVSPAWRAALKGLLGKPHRDMAVNAAREAFNQRMRTAYAGREPLFDLAQVESTRADGSRRTFRYAGHEYGALVEGYASDGRHLNVAGRRWAAANLLAELATQAAAIEAGTGRHGRAAR